MATGPDKPTRDPRLKKARDNANGHIDTAKVVNSVDESPESVINRKKKS